MTPSNLLNCYRCGHDLRASTEDCPECGYPVELSRKAIERRARRTRGVMLLAVCSIPGYFVLNVATLSAFAFIDPRTFTGFWFNMFALPVVGFVWSFILMDRVVRRRGRWVLGPWLVATLLYLVLMSWLNFRMMTNVIANA